MLVRHQTWYYMLVICVIFSNTAKCFLTPIPSKNKFKMNGPIPIRIGEWGTEPVLYYLYEFGIGGDKTCTAMFLFIISNVLLKSNCCKLLCREILWNWFVVLARLILFSITNKEFLLRKYFIFISYNIRKKSTLHKVL